jgi:hypothetical protein
MLLPVQSRASYFEAYILPAFIITIIIIIIVDTSLVLYSYMHEVI